MGTAVSSCKGAGKVRCVLYDERRQDKIQELVCQAYEKYQSDLAAGRAIKKQSFKCFVTQRAKQLHIRSVVTKGYGGTSQLDVLGYFNRRPDSPITVTGLQEWLTIPGTSREAIDEALTFKVDYSRWINRLNRTQKRIVGYLIQGFQLKEIAKFINAKVSRVRAIVREIQEQFLSYFEVEVCL